MNRCIICDLDGTLCLFDRKKKSPYNRDFENDECSEPVKFLLESYKQQNIEAEIFFLSGRSDEHREKTEEFLAKHLDESYLLIMRKKGDDRKDVIVKEEMYNNYINNKYQIDFVIDDRLQVCRLWYSLGLFVFNVNQGLIEF